MRARFAVVVILALIAGCSKSNGPQIATVSPDAFEKPSTPPDEGKTIEPATPDEREQEVLAKTVEGKLSVPPDGGEWPIVAARPVSAQPVSMTRIISKSMSVRSAAVNPASGRAIVMVWESDFKGKKDGTHLFWCDLTTGRVTHTWDTSNKDNYPVYLA